MGSNSSKRLRQKTFEGPKRPEHRKESPSAVKPVRPARQRKPPKVKTSSSSRSFRVGCDENLRSLVEKIAADMKAASLTQLETALQIRSSKKNVIMESFPGELKKQVSALIHLWINSQPHPSEEKLLKELRHVGLNYDWLLQGHRSPEAEKVQQPPPDIPQVKTREEKGTQTEEGSLPKESPVRSEKQSSGREFEDGVKAVWTPGVLYGLLKDAPDPIRTPSDFHRWLRFTCMAYQPSPAELKRLLKLVYNCKWKNVKEHFDIPGVDGEAEWRHTRDMTAWLDTWCAASIKNAAWKDPQFVPPWRILQKPGESVADFTERFHRLWNSTMSEADAFLFNLDLVNKLQPHVAELLKRQVGWETFTFSKVKFILENMELKGTFNSKNQPSVTQRHPEDSSSDLLARPEPPRSSQTRRNKRQDRCFYCSRFGHWARECRARRQHYSLEYSSQWFVLE